MTTTVLLCGDPQQPSEYMYEAAGHLERYDVEFERMDWMGTASPTEFRDVTMDMEERGPSAYDTSDIAENLDGVDVLVVHKAPVSRELVEGADELDIVGAARGGTENVAVDACEANGVTVLHAPGRNRNAVADYAVAMLLSRLRRIPSNHAALSQGSWNQVFDPERLPPEIRTTTVGVVGFGNIGRGVARRLSGFDATVLAYDPYVDNDIIRELDSEPVDDLHDLLRRADAVTLHVRLTEDTRGLLSEAEFEAMQPSAFLVNTARGGLVDEDALIDALTHGELAGAALDVFREEPLPNDHPLSDFDNVVLTPHVAGSTRDAVLEGPNVIATDIEALLQGDEPKNVVR